MLYVSPFEKSRSQNIPVDFSGTLEDVFTSISTNSDSADSSYILGPSRIMRILLESKIKSGNPLLESLLIESIEPINSMFTEQDL